MPVLSRKPQEDVPADSLVGILADDGDAAEAHTPRPHPPIEEPEQQPEEHAPETEPETEPDSDADPQRRPPRPGKAPR
jgi:hypothetical protein